MPTRRRTTQAKPATRGHCAHAIDGNRVAVTGLRAFAHPTSGSNRGQGTMDFLKSIAIAASGLRAQAGRVRVISENLANADSTAQAPGKDPFRRKIATFRAEMDRALDARTVGL